MSTHYVILNLYNKYEPGEKKNKQPNSIVIVFEYLISFYK